MEAERKDVWNGTHKGIAYEIVHWGVGKGRNGINEGQGMWNYYVLINQEQLSAEEFEKVWLPVDRYIDRSDGRKQPCYNEYQSVLNHGDFHGGITHYSKHQYPDEGYRWIKVGCDYGHLWDMEAGYHYSGTSLEWDAKHTINKLSEILRFKLRCPWNGTYSYPEEMVKDENGQLYSKAGYTANQEWREQRVRGTAA